MASDRNVRVGGVQISLAPCGRTADNRPAWTYMLVSPTFTHSASDLSGGVGAKHDRREMLVSLLSFLGACGEAYGAASRKHGLSFANISDDDNLNLFPLEVAAWAHQYSDELSILQCELEESK